MSQTNGQSIQSDVLDAVVAALGGRAGGAWRCRLTPFSQKELPSDNVIPDTETPDYTNTSDADQVFSFFVRYTLQAHEAADKAADRRFVAKTKQLQADPTLGKLVRYIRYAGRKWEMENGDPDTVSLVVKYQAEYSTSRTDPSVPGY